MSDTATRSYKWLIYVVVIAALFGIWFVLPVQEWITTFREWAEAQGSTGWFVFIVIYAIATVVSFPASILTIAAGVAWGLKGFPIVLVGATIGATLAFLVARYILRSKVQKSIENKPRLKAVERAVSEEGWKIVGLMRLSPAIPFTLQNFFFGTTSVGAIPYTLATFFGIMPGTLLYLWIATLGGEAAAGGDSASTLKYVFFGVGIIATIIVTIIVGRKAKQKLAEYGVEQANE